MLSSVKSFIFAHSLINPPSLNNSCDVNLILTNSKGKINLIKENVGLQTKYSLSISDPLTLGLLTPEQNVVDRFVRNLLLAMNLHLRRTALSIFGGDVAQPDIEFKQPEGNVRVEETPEGKHIVITETVFLRDTFHVTMGFSEEIDENKVLSTLELINKLNKNKSTENVKVNNLTKSLVEYESAMAVFDRLMIFKHLFNSLELATNYDGCNRYGQSLDTEVATVTGSQVSEVSEWRNFYNRTKHIDREPKEISEFVQGIEKLPYLLESLRAALNTLIIDRLKRCKC